MDQYQTPGHYNEINIRIQFPNSLSGPQAIRSGGNLKSRKQQKRGFATNCLLNYFDRLIALTTKDKIKIRLSPIVLGVKLKRFW